MPGANRVIHLVDTRLRTCIKLLVRYASGRMKKERVLHCQHGSTGMASDALLNRGVSNYDELPIT